MKYLTFIFALIMINSTLYSQEIIKAYDTITFEKPCYYLEIDSSVNNIWQIGKPDKNTFISAYSPVNAIVTDTIGHYPVSNYSFFDVKIGTFNLESYDYNLFIGIKHKFDTDRLKDGGYITVSHDGGLTWSNIVYDTLPHYNLIQCWDIRPGFGSEEIIFNNLYYENDTLFNGEYGFSGSSDGWVNTWFSWFCPPVQRTQNSLRSSEGDTMILRFNFISDSIDSDKDGWMIDDILLFEGDIGSATQDQLFQNPKIFPNPVSDVISIAFDEYQNDLDITIFNINGDAVLEKHHQSGYTIEIENLRLLSGIYFIKVNTGIKTLNIGKFIVE